MQPTTILTILSPRWRVVHERDGDQWVLQKLYGSAGREKWIGQSWIGSKRIDILLRCIREKSSAAEREDLLEKAAKWYEVYHHQRDDIPNVHIQK